jgi:hypothetical protein
MSIFSESVKRCLAGHSLKNFHTKRQVLAYFIIIKFIWLFYSQLKNKIKKDKEHRNECIIVF